MLVELGVVEQRFQAVLEVLGGAQVTDVARRYGVARQTVHRWLRRYADVGGGYHLRPVLPPLVPDQRNLHGNRDRRVHEGRVPNRDRR